jgi:hypothetical protein
MKALPHTAALQFTLVLAIFSGQTVLSAATVTNLQVLHRKGQSFVTFTEVSTAGITYSVYRSQTRITTLSGLSPIAILPRGSGTNLFTGQQFVISDAGPPLPVNTGLLVWTTDDSGSYYYAVTNSQDSTIVQGANSLGAPIVETRVPVPGAVLIEPRTTTGGGYPLFRYFAWEDYRTWHHETEYYGHRFDVVLERYPLDAAKTYPLVVSLHSAGVNGYREPDNYVGTAKGVYICPADMAFWYGKENPYTEHEQWYSMWFGYTSGAIAYSSTERRLKRYADLVAGDSQFRIDRARVYVTGGSLGGGGALHLAYHYPRFFAGATTSVGWIDVDAGYGYQDGVVGPRGSTFPVNSSTGPAAWDWQDMNWLVNSGTTLLPPIAHTFRKDDPAVGNQNYPSLLRATEEKKFPLIADWKNGGHSGYTIGGVADLYRFRTDEAYPAIANATSSVAFEAQEGQRNVFIDWSSSLHDLFPASTTDAIVDTGDLFTMTFQSLNGTDINAQITIRNAQHFYVTPGTSVDWENRDFTNSQVISSGRVLADSNCLVTVGLRILARGNQLVLRCSTCRTDPGLKEIRELYLSDVTPLVEGRINESEKCIVAKVPANVDLRRIRPIVKFAGVRLTPNTGVEVDFSSPVLYTVEAADGTTTSYTISVTAATGDQGCTEQGSPPPPPEDTIPPGAPTNLRAL